MTTATAAEFRAILNQIEARFPNARLELREDWPGGIDVLGDALDGREWLAAIEADWRINWVRKT